MNRRRIVLLMLLFALLGITVPAPTVQANGEGPYADLCSNADGLVWSPEAPLPLVSPCVNPGKWIALGNWPYEGQYPRTEYATYEALLEGNSAYEGGIVWQETDFAALCSNSDAFRFNADNPLPDGSTPPCLNAGRWGLQGTTYPLTWFGSLSEVLAEAQREELTEGLLWFEVDWSIICSNENGYIWNAWNPLPLEAPCLGEGEWVTVGNWPFSGEYPQHRFVVYLFVLQENDPYDGGALWFEPAIEPSPLPTVVPTVIGTTTPTASPVPGETPTATPVPPTNTPVPTNTPTEYTVYLAVVNADTRDFSGLCANTDGLVWGTDNPLPRFDPCPGKTGTWTARSFGGPEYPDTFFGTYRELWYESLKYEGGTTWFEETIAAR